MPNSRRINLSTAKSSSNTPLIFISHDTRDKDLASEFKKLIHAVSSGLWSSFQSSDQGIEYGSEWYPTILKSLKSASHVVCLLTERSVNRPWILYEAGIAKGEAGIAKSKSGKPVIVIAIAIGIPLSQASTGPFAQFQNLDDSEESLTELFRQLLGVHPFDPLLDDIKAKVKTFKAGETEALRRIAERQPREDSMPATLQRLRDNWETYQKSHPNDPYRTRFKLYTFCGLTDTPESDEASPETDLEDVYYLWADAGAGSSVQAQVLRQDGKKLTRIRFDNKEGAPGNVAFRINGRNLLYKEGGFRTLKFSTRIPADSEQGDLPTVQMGLRVVDALKTHWIYSREEWYKALYAEKGEWSEQTIDLSKAKWNVFPTDGNALYHDDKPDFSMILAVVVEVGGRSPGRAGGGKGVVDIEDFSVE